MNDKINILENEILRLKKELNIIVNKLANDNDSLIQYRISCIENDIRELNRTLSVLKSELAQDNPTAVQSGFSKATPQYAQPDFASTTAQTIQPDFASTTTQTIQPQTMTPQYVRTYNRGAKKDLEKAIGKSFMGIFASVLIFISLILLATLVYPYLNDAIKVTSMYAISVAFCIVGMFKLKKNESSPLYISITGCGLGALYISMLLTNIYFKLIGDITLYILILVWAIGVCIISKLHSKIFLIIGHAGVTIAMIFGQALCLSCLDATKYLVLTVFYIISFGLFYFSHLLKEYSDNTISNSFFMLNSIIYIVFLMLFNDSYVPDTAKTPLAFNIVVVIMTVFSLVYILFNMLWTGKAYGDGEFGIFTAVNTFIMNMFVLLSEYTFNLGEVYGCIAVALVSLFIFIYAARLYGNKTSLSSIIISASSAIWIAIASLSLSGFSSYVSLALWIIPLVIFGYKNDNRIFRFIAVSYYAIFTFQSGINTVSCLVFGIIIFALIAYNSVMCRHSYSSFTKTASYIIFFILIIRNLSDIAWDAGKEYRHIIYTCQFVLLCTLNMIASKSRYRRSPVTGEDDRAFIRTTNMANAFLMLLSLYKLGSTKNELEHIIVICFAVAIFMMNSGSLIKKHNRTIVDIYVGLKLTVLMYAILNSFNTPNYLLSIIFFILAILSIVTGFKIKRKPLRIYGLGLSLLSIVKLVMLDIHYDNTLGNALSFFICGVLCFVINIIYSRIDKKLDGC